MTDTAQFPVPGGKGDVRVLVEALEKLSRFYSRKTSHGHEVCSADQVHRAAAEALAIYAGRPQ